MKENLYSTSIRTYSGRYVDVFHPVPEMFCIDDIAWSLSNQCRFAGHTKIFYSVAEHCIDCYSRNRSLEALMHDASEAYLVDIPRPIKNQIHDYQKIEHNLNTVLSAVFGFKYPFSKSVKKADEIALKWEWENVVLRKNRKEKNKVAVYRLYKSLIINEL